MFAPSGRLRRLLDKLLSLEDLVIQYHGAHSQDAQDVRKVRREAELMIPDSGSDGHESL